MCCEAIVLLYDELHDVLSDYVMRGERTPPATVEYDTSPDYVITVTLDGVVIVSEHDGCPGAVARAAWHSLIAWRASRNRPNDTEPCAAPAEVQA